MNNHQTHDTEEAAEIKQRVQINLLKEHPSPHACVRLGFWEKNSGASKR